MYNFGNDNIFVGFVFAFLVTITFEVLMAGDIEKSKNVACTIGAVAKLAKVSPMSVTRTYSAPEKVSEKIKTKV